jgi:hypothetical protein
MIGLGGVAEVIPLGLLLRVEPRGFDVCLVLRKFLRKHRARLLAATSGEHQRQNVAWHP